MKRKGVIYGFLILVISGIMLSSCIKENNGKTIALIGEEYYIKDIHSVIPDSLQATFEAMFQGIPSGAIPVDIVVPDSIEEDAYVVHTNMLVKTNLWNVSSPIPYPDVYMRFSKQHNGIVVVEFAESTEQRTDTAFIMGNNNDFTVYFAENKDISTDIHVKRGVVMCGTKTSVGLSGFRMAIVVLESEGDQAPTPGTYYYYKDGDGLAERCVWPWP